MNSSATRKSASAHPDEFRWHLPIPSHVYESTRQEQCMTLRTLTRLAAFTSLTLTLGIQLAGQDSSKPSRYTLIDLGTLGGPNSTFQDGTRTINAQGVVIPDLDTTQPDLAVP